MLAVLAPLEEPEPVVADECGSADGAGVSALGLGGTASTLKG